MRVRVIAPLCLGAAVLILSSGCSSNGNGGGNAGAGVPKDQFLTQLGNAYCDGFGACCTSAGVGYDVAACKQNLATNVGAELVDPLRSYDATAAARCVAVADAMTKACAPDYQALGDACGKAIVGTVAAGGACTAQGQCAVPAGADWANCTAGACVVTTHGKLGDACSSSCNNVRSGGYLCTGSSGPTPADGAAACWTEDGLACVGGKCASTGAIGSPCVQATCVPGAYCGGTGVVPACFARGATGAACTADGECVSGDYCEISKCAPLKMDGATCTSDMECTSRYCNAKKQCHPATILDEPKVCSASNASGG
jgi:hypothetical protein